MKEIMTSDEKIKLLNEYCPCICYEEFCKCCHECQETGKWTFESMNKEQIDKCFNAVFESKITEKLTGVIKGEERWKS